MLRAALLSLALLAVVAPALAQEDASSGSGAPAPSVTVPVGQISSRAQGLEARLKQIELLRPTKALERIEEQLAEARKSAAAATERTEVLLARRHNPIEIEAHSTRWKRLDAAFESLETQAGRQVDILDGVLAEIADETAAWQETLRAAQRTLAPPAVEREAQRSLERLSGAKTQVGSDLEAALGLRDRVRRAREALAPTLERLALARSEFTAGLLQRQDEPVWRSLPGLTELSGLGAKIAAEASAIWTELGQYASSRRDLLLVHAFLFIVLGWSLSRTRAWRDLRHRPSIDAADALRHPWAAAFLIAIVVTPLFQPERSRGFYLVVYPVALLAWHRALAGLLVPALRRPLFGLAVLGLVEIARYVFIGVSMIDRTLLVLDLAAALAGIVWMRRQRFLDHTTWVEARSVWLRMLDGWLRIVALALAAGLTAALLGYTSLADCIATLTIWATIVGGVAMALVRVAEAVAEQLLEHGALLRLRVIRSRRDFLRRLRSVLRVLGVFAWASGTLGSAGLWSPARSAVAFVLSYPIGYGPVAVSPGALIAFGLTLWISWVVARFVALALNEEVFTRVRMPPGVPFAVATLSRWVVFVIGFMIAMGSIGFTLDRVTLLLSAVGVGIGFGLQSVVNNFVSGMILLFERPIRVGDRVQIGDLFGIVSSIGIRASKVRTFDGADVVVPNGDFISGRVTNWTLSDRKRRIILPVGVAYGTNPRRVIELLEETARRHPEVLADPVPRALFRGFGDSALNFEIQAFTEGDFLAVLSDLAVATSESLDAAGITIPFPQRDLHLRNVGELRDALEKVLQPPDRPPGR